jgi:hypothetical protein
MSTDPIEAFHLNGERIRELDGDYREIQRAIAAILAIDGDDVLCLGSGFCICSSPWLVVTALHVIKSIIDRHEPTSGPYLRIAHETSDLTQHDPQAFIGGALQVDGFFSFPSSDLAILRVADTRSGGHRVVPVPLELSPGLPSVAEHCYAVGYSHITAGPLTSADGRHSIEFERRLAVTQGHVQQVWPRGRDRVLLPSPAFATDAEFRHGMSGGPVVMEGRGVVGIMSTGIDHAPHSPLATSMASLMFPLLAWQPLLTGPEQGSVGPTLYDWAVSGRVPVDSTIEEFDIEPVNGGVRVSFLAQEDT